MNVTSVIANPTVMKQVVNRINSIIQVCHDCAKIEGLEGHDEHHFPTFVGVMRNVSVTIENDEPSSFSLTVPTVQSRLWISHIDPFLLAEGLREIGVDMRLAVFDIDNPKGFVVNE